jgi:TetR/AcrR family acrAB operon transcriptional repressor
LWYEVRNSAFNEVNVVRKTKEEAQETRNRLLDAASQVFCEKGVTNTSLVDIAEAAGVTRGAIYWHFRNKYDLIEALWERTKMPLDEAWAECCAQAEHNPLGRIRQNAIDMLRRAATDEKTGRVYNILFHKCECVEEAQPMLERRLESRKECAPKIETFFQAAIDAGQLPNGLDPVTAMIGLFSYLDGLIYNWFIHPELIHLDELAEYYVDLYLDGLRHARATPKPARPPLAQVK